MTTFFVFVSFWKFLGLSEEKKWINKEADASCFTAEQRLFFFLKRNSGTYALASESCPPLSATVLQAQSCSSFWLKRIKYKRTLIQIPLFDSTKLQAFNIVWMKTQTGKLAAISLQLCSFPEYKCTVNVCCDPPPVGGHAEGRLPELVELVGVLAHRGQRVHHVRVPEHTGFRFTCYVPIMWLIFRE